MTNYALDDFIFYLPMESDNALVQTAFRYLRHDEIDLPRNVAAAMFEQELIDASCQPRWSAAFWNMQCAATAILEKVEREACTNKRPDPVRPSSFSLVGGKRVTEILDDYRQAMRQGIERDVIVSDFSEEFVYA